MSELTFAATNAKISPGIPVAQPPLYKERQFKPPKMAFCVNASVSVRSVATKRFQVGSQLWFDHPETFPDALAALFFDPETFPRPLSVLFLHPETFLAPLAALFLHPEMFPDASPSWN